MIRVLTSSHLIALVIIYLYYQPVTSYLQADDLLHFVFESKMHTKVMHCTLFFHCHYLCHCSKL